MNAFKTLLVSVLAIVVEGQRLDIPMGNDGMIPLTDENFDRIVGYLDNLLVFAYAPWW